MTDHQPLEPDRQIQDDLGNWSIPPVQPSQPEDYFPNDALINDEDVPTLPQKENEA